jgi:acyl-CoA synthetase (AMP-forming)/AMP-acid ligase II
VSYGELYERSQRVAALLYGAGLRRGDGVALVLPNRPEFLEITWGCQHAQFVPTMFVRMLKLPEAVRRSYDVSSLRCVIHAAAPCPVDVKHRMMKWFGPIIHEYYGGTEGFAGSTIGPRSGWPTLVR